MRLQAALQGNLKEAMSQELEAATEGVVRGIQQATEGLKAMLRAQVVSSGLGRSLSKTWRSQVYLNKRINAAGLVFSKAPQIVDAFDQGVTIRAKNKKYLAIPTPGIRKMGRFRKNKITPKNWPESRLGKLVFLPGKNGNAVLMAVKKYKRKAPIKIVAFVLIRETRLRKRLDIHRAHQRILALLPKLIQKNYQED